MTASSPIDILILGAGWTSTFLIPLLTTHGLTYAATSRSSHPKPDTIPFEYDQQDSSPDESQFANLPDVRTVLVTFPITVKGATERLVRLYEKTRVSRKAGEGEKTRWIQLGTTSVWDVRIRVQSYHISIHSGHPDHLMVVRGRQIRTWGALWFGWTDNLRSTQLISEEQLSKSYWLSLQRYLRQS